MGNLNSIKIKPKKFKIKYALGLIDIQNDFFKGGLKQINNAEEILAPINKLRFFCCNYMPTFLTQNYYHSRHSSFTKKNTLITEEIPHCIKNTSGCEFHKDLVYVDTDIIFRKGINKYIHSYSAFGDENMGQYEDTGLKCWLLQQNITDIILVGLATDTCIYNTVLDAITFGFRVHLILTCIYGIDIKISEEAIKHMSNLNGVILYNDVNDFYKLNKDIFMN